MYFYLVEKIGEGTRIDPYRPNYDGAFIWNPDHICPTCNTCIIVTNEPTEYLREVADLESACLIRRGLNIDDVVNWFVGGDS